MKQLNFKEFTNEGIFKNIIDMAGRSVKDWAMQPLTDMMKDISKSGDPKKIIKSLLVTPGIKFFTTYSCPLAPSIRPVTLLTSPTVLIAGPGRTPP
jgi:hypothetical protein